MNNQVVEKVPLIDPTVTLFSRMYLPLIILSAVILVFFILPPVLVLLLFPTTCFMKVSTYLKPRWVLGLKIFTDTFYGSYKDGTNGTRDFRQVAGIIFLIWVVFEIVAKLNISGTILPVVVIILAVMYNILNTYKFSTEMALLSIAVATLPHCVFYGYGIYWLAKWLKQCTVHGEEGILCRIQRMRNYKLLMNPAGSHSRV